MGRDSAGSRLTHGSCFITTASLQDLEVKFAHSCSTGIHLSQSGHHAHLPQTLADSKKQGWHD